MDRLLHRKSLHLGLWELVFKILQEQSFSRVADQRGLDRTQVSRLIKNLEEEIGHDLFIRNGPRLVPTQFALETRARLEPILEEFSETLMSVTDAERDERGLIRIGSRPEFMQSQILPILGDFQRIHPHITFDIVAENDPRAYMRGQTDVVFYYGPVNNPNLMENWVSRAHFVACASPNYIANHGLPESPQALSDHVGIVYTGRQREQKKVLVSGSKSSAYQWRSILRVNNIKSVKATVLAGAGIVPDMPLHQCYQELIEGDLVPVVQGWHVPTLDFYVGTTLEAAKLKRVQLFVEWYVQKRREIETKQKQRLEEKFGFAL